MDGQKSWKGAKLHNEANVEVHMPSPSQHAPVHCAVMVVVIVVVVVVVEVVVVDVVVVVVVVVVVGTVVRLNDGLRFNLCSFSFFLRNSFKKSPKSFLNSPASLLSGIISDNGRLLGLSLNSFFSISAPICSMS